VNRWGCAGLMVGGGIGFLLITIFILLSRPALSVITPPARTIPPDATLFASSRVLSRLATDSLQQPALIEFTPTGDMRITTTTPVGPFDPVVTGQIQLQMQGANVVSYLQWVKVGFLYFPGQLLPASGQEAAALLGQTIQAQTPPDFVLVGIDTTPEGLEFKLKWVGH
jgi:hypothetical protein